MMCTWVENVGRTLEVEKLRDMVIKAEKRVSDGKKLIGKASQNGIQWCNRGVERMITEKKGNAGCGNKVETSVRM